MTTPTPVTPTPADVARRRTPEPPEPISAPLYGFESSFSPLETLKRALGNERAYRTQQAQARRRAAEALDAATGAIAESTARIAEYEATIERLEA